MISVIDSALAAIGKKVAQTMLDGNLVAQTAMYNIFKGNKKYWKRERIPGVEYTRELI
jgi:hypothetical protein